MPVSKTWDAGEPLLSGRVFYWQLPKWALLVRLQGKTSVLTITKAGGKASYKESL